ncbi:hypothetical protein BH23CHL4_BH23CHL4_21170 [soil metagenome]
MADLRAEAESRRGTLHYCPVPIAYCPVPSAQCLLPIAYYPFTPDIVNASMKLRCRIRKTASTGNIASSATAMSWG